MESGALPQTKKGFGTFLDYWDHSYNVPVHTGIEKGTGTLTFMASTGEQSYNGLGAAVPPVTQ